MNDRQKAGSLYVVVSAIGASTLALFGVQAFASGANVNTFLAIRFSFASVVLWLLCLYRKEKLPDKETLISLVVMGAFGYTLMSSLFLSSVDQDRLSPGIAALLLYTYPIGVTVLSWKFDGQRLSRNSVLAMLLISLGVALVLIAPNEKTIVTPIGSLLALSAAVVYSLYIVFGRRASNKTGPLMASTMICTTTALSFVLLSLISGSWVPLPTEGWLASFGAGFMATVLAITFFFAGLERLGPTKTAALSTIEPVSTVVLSMVLFNQVPVLSQMIGILIVLAGVRWIQKMS